MSAPIDWTAPIVARDGTKANYDGICPMSGRHQARLHFQGHYYRYFYDDLGRTRGDKKQSPRDVLNVDGGAA